MVPEREPRSHDPACPGPAEVSGPVPAFPRSIATSAAGRGIVLIVLSAAAAIAADFDPLPGRAASRSELFLEKARLAPFASVPALYFRQTADFWQACLAGIKPAPQGGLCDSLCSEAISAASRLDSNHLSDKTSNEYISAFRSKLLLRFHRDFSPDPALSDPGFLRKARLLAYLESPRFFEFLGSQPVADTAIDLAESLQSEMRSRISACDCDFSAMEALDSVPWSRHPPTPHDKLLIFLSKVVYNLMEQLRLSVYAAIIPRLDALLSSPGFDEAFTNYDYLRLLETIQDDSLRARIWLPRAPAFSHHLNTLLHDAVWVDEMAKAPPLHLSGYLLRGSMPLSPSDSSRVADMIREFGERHRDLAYRIDIFDRSTWKDKRAIELDELASQEARRINMAVSKELRSHLDFEPVAELRVLIHGLWHADYFGSLRVYSGLKEVLREIPDSASSASKEWLEIAFPVVGKDLAGTGLLKRKGLNLVRHRLGKDPVLYNSLLLTLGPALWEDFQGVNKTLKILAAGKRRL